MKLTKSVELQYIATVLLLIRKH